MKKYTYLTAATWLAIFALWLAATGTGLVDETLMPKPRAVWDALVETGDPAIGYNGHTLWRHLLVSLYRLLAAVAAAILTAVPLGLLSGYFIKVRAVVDSIVQFYRPIPPLAYYTLLVLWMGIGDSSKVMLLYLAAFAPVYIACAEAVAMVDRRFILNARSMGATRWQVFRHVVFPASLPQVFLGVRTAVGFAYTTLVSAEMVAAVSGIGWMVLDAHRFLKYDIVFLGVIIMGVTGVLIDWGLREMENKYIFWKGK